MTLAVVKWWEVVADDPKCRACGGFGQIAYPVIDGHLFDDCTACANSGVQAEPEIERARLRVHWLQNCEGPKHVAEYQRLKQFLDEAA